MTWVHLHLALNHIPVLGTLFLFILLLAGVFRRSEELKRASLWGLALLTAVSIPIKFTGDYAYEATASDPWMTEALAKAHEQAADQATTAIFLTGILAAFALVLGRRGRPVPNWICGVVLILALLTFLLMARTANLGGRLRHPEIRPGAGAVLRQIESGWARRLSGQLNQESFGLMVA